jgi:SAM-dependent methyltransferase
MFSELKKIIKPFVPFPIWQIGKKYYARIKKFPVGESTKAKMRRKREGFFKNYCRGKGLDIGHGNDLLTLRCKGWDRDNGDAHYLEGLKDLSFDFVYSSHTLEHMTDLSLALKNWWRVVKPGGYLILFMPHREFYEKKSQLPSRWNSDHKNFFLLDKDDPPDTIGILPLINQTLDNFETIYAKSCCEGHTIDDPSLHSDGEYSIEVVIKKGIN